MSYEGYEQLLCPDGHYWQLDCRSPIEAPCPRCEKKAVWWNSVNETNGPCDPETGERIDGYVELEEMEPAKTCTCPTCMNVHQVEPPKYRIPEGVGHRMNSSR